MRGQHLPPTRLGETGRSIQSSLGMAFIHISKANLLGSQGANQAGEEEEGVVLSG